MLSVFLYIKMDEAKIKKVEKLARLADDPSKTIFDELQEVKEEIKGAVPGELKVEIKGAEVVTIKGEQGEVGPEPSDERLRGIIIPLIPEPIEGRPGEKGEKGDKPVAGVDYPIPENGKDGIDGRDGESIVGPPGAPGKDGSPDTGEQIIEKINEAEGLIKKEKIEGLDEAFDSVSRQISSIPRGGGGSRSKNSSKFYDLSSQTDGVTKSFLVPKSVGAVLFGSDFPSVYMEGNGFTINATRTQITLTTDNAPSTGSQLLFLYTEMFNT
jgi:hypothetical protein